MKQKEQNSINMWRVVINYLDTRSSVWDSNAFFSQAKAELDQALREVESAFQQQVAGTAGATKSKEAVEQHAAREVFSVAKVARAYALHTGNESLSAAVNFAPTHLLKLPGAELLQHLRNVLKAVQPFAAQLQELGLESLQPAFDATEAFSKALAEPRTAISERSQATAQVPKIMKQGRIALEKLDNLVHVFDVKSPGFSNGYKPCRITVDAGHRFEKGDTASSSAS